MERMGNISKETRENTRGNLPTKEKGHRSHRAKMDYANGKWGTEKEKEEIDQAYKKRNALQKEIDKGERDLLKQQKIKTKEK